VHGTPVSRQFYLFDALGKNSQAGPALGYPQSTGVNGSKFSHMRELRIQHEGRPYRILYAFDPTRTAFLLLGGDKTGDERWYDKMVPKADAIYADHLKSL
jgi:hypothetical protein